MKPTLLLLSICTVAFCACLPVTGDRILARDLAIVKPEFARLPATLTIGFAPVPGAPRVFASAEIARLAHANGLAVTETSETCFEFPMRPLVAEAAIVAMRASLPPQTEVKIVELPKENVPAGDLEFPIGGIEPPAISSPDVQLWHGFVKYTSTRRLPIWARVSILQKLEAVVTSRDLQPNVPITAQSLRLGTWSGQPVRERVAVRLEDVLGKIPKKPVKAGSLIPLALLDEAPLVRRGETVRVEVQSGPARLLFSAVAEKAARDGDMVELRNPSTGKMFLARLAGAKAVVVVGGL